MGVKTKLLLSQAQELFPDKNIIALIPTIKGVIDTTYTVHTQKNSYILKKYERAAIQQIKDESSLLRELKQANFQVPQPVASSGVWHLFTHISGEMPHKIELQQIVIIGRFLAKFHTLLHKKSSSFTPFHTLCFQKKIQKLRKEHLLFSKKLSSLKNFPKKHDGIIHGDLFPDNAKFEGSRLGVFDFIEAGNGSFSFDLGVVALSWIAQKSFSLLRLKLLLQAYNQQTLHKVTLSDMLEMMEHASLVYALKRFISSDSTLDSKEMLLTHQKITNFKKSL